MTDEDFMQRAIDLGRTNPHQPFGAVLVDRSSNVPLAEGINQSGHHPLLHGEIVAIDHCVKQQANVNWSSLTLFTTAEPCPMCMSAILWSGISRVVYGTSIPTLMQLGWSQIDIRAAAIVAKSHRLGCELVPNILGGECDALFRTALMGNNKV